MKKLLFFSFLFITFYSQAQWNPTGSKVRFAPGIGIGTRDTASYSNVTGHYSDSAIIVMHLDSSIYYKYKSWFKTLGGSGGGSGTVTSVGINNASGLTGTTFTVSGTIGADTTILETRARGTANLIGYAPNALVVKYTDTSSMLANYIRTQNWGLIKTAQAIGADSSLLSTKANVTASLLGYAANALVVKYTDTSSMLSSRPNLTYVTSNLATKLNVTDSVLANRITSDRNFVNASLPLKLNVSDTAAMLGTNYYNKVTVDGKLGLKVNYTDTSSMLGNYVRTSNYGITKTGQAFGVDTAAMSTKANVVALLTGYTAGALVVKYTDTASMLSTHPNTTLVNSLNALNVKYTDTASMLSTHPNKTYVDANIATKQNTLTLTTTGTSGAATLVGATLNIPNYATGGGGTTTNALTLGNGLNTGSFNGSAAVTATVDTLLITTKNWHKKGIDSVANVASVANALKLNISDTAAMLGTNYYNKVTVDGKLGLEVKYTDTATMLSGYKTFYPRTAISLTTTGTSGAATYNNGTGVLNIPSYAGGGGTTTNALTMNSSGTGAVSGTTFDGSAAQTISYNTIGAIGGSGTNLQLALFNGSNTLTSNSNFQWATSPYVVQAIGGTPSLTDPTSDATKPHLFQIINNATTQQVMSMASMGAVGSISENDVHFIRAGGTVASPSATPSGSYFLSFGMRGYDGTAYTQSAGAFQAVATSAWTSVNQPVKFIFQTTPTGSDATARATAFEIRETKDIFAANNILMYKSTLPTWNSTYRVFNMPGDGGIRSNIATSEMAFYNNIVYNSSWTYANTGYGSIFALDNGGNFVWQTAPTGIAAAAATVTQVMKLTNTGALTLNNLSTAGVVTNTAAGLIGTSNGTGFLKMSAGTISYDNSTYLTTATATSTYSPLAGSTSFTTAGTITTGTWNAGAITSSGNIQGTQLSLGSTLASDRMIYITGTAPTSGTSQYGMVFNPTFGTTATNYYGMFVQLNVTGAFSATNMYSLYIPGIGLGGGATSTSKYGVYQAGTEANFFGGAITASSLIKSGGTSAQYLMADGSTSTGGAGSGTTTNAVTFNNSNAGAASGTTFNGATAQTISANTVGAVALTGSTMTGGLILPATTTSITPLQIPLGVLNTTPVQGGLQGDGNGFLNYTHVGGITEIGVIQATQEISLTTAYTLTSQTAAQKAFNSSTNGALTVAASTTYYFEGMISLSSMSATSGSFGFALGGTATLTSVQWQSSAVKAATLTTATAPQMTFNATAANTTMATASTATNGFMYVNGIVRINASGTLIPQVSLGVAAAAVVGTNSYFRLTPVGSNTTNKIGNWN